MPTTYPELRAQYQQFNTTRTPSTKAAEPTEPTPVNKNANKSVFNYSSGVMDGINKKAHNYNSMAIDATKFAMGALMTASASMHCFGEVTGNRAL